MIIRTEEQLRKIYGWPKGRAQSKSLLELEKHSKNFIKNSPFLILSTFDKLGRADASPRGGKPGFVKILDDITLLIPDSKGNNRVDSLVNIIETGSAGCLFLIPGIDESLRVNGTAVISTDKSLIEMFSDERNIPKSVIVLTINELFLHCAKAMMRSRLWSDEFRISRPGFPTMGTMLSEQLGSTQNTESQEEMVERYKKDL